MSAPLCYVNPATLVQPVGFSHGVVSAGGRILWLAGQNGTDAAGTINAPGDLVAQTDQALANILAVLAAAGGAPEAVVKLNLYVTSAADYRQARGALGRVWRRHFGRHYPAMMLLEVNGFFDPAALIEIEGVAVLQEEDHANS